MSKIFQIVPTNRKTLFLRNIEMYMITNGVLEEKNIKKFRGKTSEEILGMLYLYINDEKNNSSEYLSRTYEYDSYVLRKRLFNKIISKQ
jgi:hypothetical protein